MKKTKCVLSFLLGLLFFLTILPMAYGDLYWVSEVETGGLPKGLPENLPKEVRDQMAAQFKNQTTVQKHYLTAYASRIETTEGITIMDYESMTMYQLNPGDKTYTRIDMTSAMEGQMGEMAKKMAEDTQVIPTNETQRIGGYECKKYIVNMMGSKTDYWLSKDVKGYKEFGSISRKILEKHPELKQMQTGGITGEDGFPVKTVSDMMGMQTVTSLKEIKQTSLNKDLFEIPAGYKLVGMKRPFK